MLAAYVCVCMSLFFVRLLFISNKRQRSLFNFNAVQKNEMRLLPGGSSLYRCQFERFESRNCQRELRHNQPDAAAVAPGAAAPVAVAVACHTFHFAHFHHFRFSISLWQTIWRSRCRPIGVCNKKLSLLPFCIQNACNKQNAFTCAQLSTLMQRNKPPGCRDSSTTGCQYGRMPCPCLHSLSPMPNPLRAIYSIISFSYSYFPAAATDVAAAAVASVWCTALAF